VDILVTATAQPCEYAVLMRYPTGNPASIQLGYQEIKPEEAQRHEWLQKVRTAAGDGSAEGLIRALHSLKELISPLADSFTPVTATAGTKTPLIPIDFKNSDKPKKKSSKDKIQELLNNPLIINMVLYPLGIIAGLLGFWWLFSRMRPVTKLVESVEDLRLSSPYGAGVSRHVRYLEGTEASKEKRLF
jgi:hypothetical protein